MARLTELASARGVQIVEDAAQAHGAERNGFRAGTAGIAGCFSFYPGQEPRRDGRRRRADDRRSGPRRARAVAARARADGQVPPRRRRLHVAPRHDPGARAAAQAAAARRLERRAAPGAPPTTSSTWRASATSRCPRWPRAASRSGTCSRCRPPTRPGSARTWRERGVGTGRHYPDPVHLSPAYRNLGYARGRVPGGGAGRERARSRCRSSPASARSSSSTSSHAVRGVLRRWLTRPSTRRRGG